jgi:hydrocephalus-inducing protein
MHFMPVVIGKKGTLDVQLINSTPIPVTVDAQLTAKTKGVKTVPFELGFKSVVIPAESIKVLPVGFQPLTPDPIAGQVDVTVRGSTKALRFGVDGSGSCPSIALVTPMDRSGKAGNFNLVFGRVLVGFSREKVIAVKNDSPILALVTVNFKTAGDFEFGGQDGSEVAIEPGRIMDFTVNYSPQKVRKCTADLSFSLRDNPRANFGVSCAGEGYSDDVILEGLEDDCLIAFPDAVVGVTSDLVFAMRNVGGADVRFQWGQNADFELTPRVGHLRAGQVKEIRAIFRVEKPTKHSGTRLSCTCAKVELEGDGDWDDAKKLIRFVRPNPSTLELATPGRKARQPTKVDTAAAAAAAQMPVVRVTECLPEPPYTLITTAGVKAKELQVRVNAVADVIKFNIDTPSIEFSPTMMYQSRSVDVRVSNSCNVRFGYGWQVVHFESVRTDYAATRRPPFSVRPTSGVIEAGQATIFKVQFAPEEVDDFAASLQMTIVGAPITFDPPRIAVSGISKRPICHLDIERSDYLLHRAADYVSDALLPDTRVVELFSPTIGVKRVKRVDIVNTTALPYEVVWTCKSENSAIECETKTGLVSSGKKFPALFSFTPVSPKTVEAQFEFGIAVHNLSVTILFVGRVVPAS